MSLATRCPSCGTVFRVVQDQLRISEGWVRCGRCNGVFDATEVLFDIDLGTPVRLDLLPPARPDSATPGAPLALADVPGLMADGTPGNARGTRPAATGRPPPDEPDTPVVITDWDGPLPGRAAAGSETADAPWPGAGRIEPPGTRAAPAGTPDPDHSAPWLRAPSADTDPADAIDDEIHIVDATPTVQTAPGDTVPAAAWTAGNGAGTDAETAAADTAAPAFLRAADRAAWWRRPAVRAGLTLGVALLAGSAVLQAALLERDLLAARAPATAPALNGLCRLFGCMVLAPRRIDALTVDSSQLGRLDTPGLYRLQLALRNRANLVLLAPALELSLTDGQGRPVVRRVLQVHELGLASPTLLPGQAVTLQATLSAGAQRIDGYTVELFYP